MRLLGKNAHTQGVLSISHDSARNYELRLRERKVNKVLFFLPPNPIVRKPTDMNEEAIALPNARHEWEEHLLLLRHAHMLKNDKH